MIFRNTAIYKSMYLTKNELATTNQTNIYIYIYVYIYTYDRPFE